MKQRLRLMIPGITLSVFLCICAAFAGPTALIWAPSTDIQPYGEIHLSVYNYTPLSTRSYVQQIYGPTFSLLSDKPENNLLGKLWSPLGKIMAEIGFDYKRGLGSTLDKWPVYGNFKFGVPENGYFKNMPAFAVGCYDMGYKYNFTNNNVWYLRGAKTFNIAKINLGRFSAGYFNGNGRILLGRNGLRDNQGPMIAWERVMSEISDKLWLCVDYQGTQSTYGSTNYGFSWKFNEHVSAILGYDAYNNHEMKDTITCQFGIDF
jgi:hypothetical protein